MTSCIVFGSHLRMPEYRVLEWLRTNGWLSATHAKTEFGLNDLADVINTLRGYGHRIYEVNLQGLSAVPSPAIKLYLLSDCSDLAGVAASLMVLLRGHIPEPSELAG